jgi:PAS domain S-box-containing protein
MQLNLRVVITLITWLALGLAVLTMAIRWARRTHPGYRRWAIAGLLLVLSLFLLSFRPAPIGVKTISANTGIALASILYLEGAREFRGLAPRSWLAYLGGIVAIGAVAFFSYVVPNMNVRAAVMSAFLGVILMLVSIRLLRGIPPSHRFGQAFTGNMFAVCAATLLARAFYCYVGPPMSEGNALSGVYGTFFIATIVEMGAFSLGLTLMADERVISELKEVRERASSAGTEVAKLIEAQTLLRESEERFRFAQRAARIGTFDWNIETGVNTWTPELEELYGLPPGAFGHTQKAWEDLIHPADRASALRRVAESFEIRSPVEEEWRVIWPDGSVHWITGRWQVFRNATGEPTRMMGVNIDVTERKNMEEAVRKSEERLRLAIKATNDAIYDLDLKAGTVSWNDTYSALYGRPPETADSWQFWMDRIHPEERARTVDSLQAALHSGESSWTSEYRFRRADGRWAYIYDRAYIARDTVGNPWRVIGAMQDLTEQKQVEAAMRESEERFRRVFEEGPLGIGLVGKDHRFLKVNNSLCQMVGYSEAELVQKTFAEITHPDDVRADEELARRLFRREIPFYHVQKRYVKKNGEIIWINLTATLILDADGEPLHGLGMVEEVTELKRTQEEAFARQKLESLGTLASGIAHDFNNLLGGVLAQAELALGELAAGSRPDDELKAVRDVALRGSEIVRELMVYAGKETTAEGLVDVTRIVREMLELLKVSVSKHAAIKMELGDDIPAVRASAAQLRQIVMNLVTNASEAIGDHDGAIRVSTKCIRAGRDGSGTILDRSADESYLQLEVSDTGRGMSSEMQARVFDPFFTTKSAGRGLGLAVVQGIVRGLQGSIHITSELGKGTTFRILLPCADAKAAKTHDPTSGDHELERLFEGKTALVVEDEAPLRKPVAVMLRKSGFRVFEAADGSSAIDLLRVSGGEIDVILLDMTIPGPSSREVVAEATKVRPDINVILTSAYSREMIADAMDAPQIRDFIRKPYQFGDLLHTLRNVFPWQRSQGLG